MTITMLGAVYADSLSFLHDVPGDGLSGPKFKDRSPIKNTRTKEVVCIKSEKRYILMEICAILHSGSTIGLQKEGFLRDRPRLEVKKTFFQTVAKGWRIISDSSTYISERAN